LRPVNVCCAIVASHLRRPRLRANLPNARLPPPSGLNFSNRPDRPKPDFGDFVPISFFGPSKRKTTRGAHYRTRPSQPFISRTAKSPKSDRLPTACTGNPAAPVTAPCFPAAVPIWGGRRGNSRAKPSNPHTFLCTPCFGTPRSTLLALFTPSWPGKSAKRVFTQNSPAIHVLARSPGLAALARGWN
jgi:hypothetical protein